MSKPIVAIVGRPNVGKSTLFNKISGSRISIVEDTPGVTRDRIYNDIEWNGRALTLVDTGGIEPRVDDMMLGYMREQAQTAIETADVIVFMVDVTTGVTASDRDVATMLMKSRKPLILCVNKVDSVGELPMEYYEFYELGIDGDPIPVSSVHGTGTGDFAIQACQTLHPQELIGTDISEGMMNVGREKVKAAGLDSRISFAKEDCTALTFPDKRFDAITVAFGVRNFEDLDKGLREMHRVLKDNGKLVILELSEPDWFPMKQLYAVYSKIVIPTLGKLLSKDRSAYTYLPQSIKAFPQGEIMTDIIRKAGFNQVSFKRLTLGICTLYLATK